MDQKSVRMGASNEVARVVLARLLRQFQQPLSWRRFYDPGLRWYVLNIHVVLDAPSSGPSR